MKYTNRTASLVVLALASCSDGSQTEFTVAKDETLATGRLALAVSLPDAERDVAAFTVAIHESGDSCSGTPIETFEMLMSLDGLSTEGLPEGIGEERVFADEVLVLEAGDYLACVQPRTLDGAASDECAAAQQLFAVEAGATVDVLLISECETNPTGLTGVSAALNSPPQITALEITPSRFIDACEILNLEVEAEDPDGDEVQVTWEVAAQPEGSVPELSEAGATASFVATEAGSYTISVNAVDPLGSSSSIDVSIVVTDGEPSLCGCPVGTQDNDGDGSCSPDCANTSCAGTCDDSSGTAICSTIAAKTVFVTSTPTAGGFGGVFGGDSFCQTHAAAAGLTGTYFAWVSDGASPAGRFFQSDGPYALVDGTQIAANWADLTDGTLDHQIDLTEISTLYSGAVWSSTAVDGTFVGSVSCNGWTALGSNVTGLVGSSEVTAAQWTVAGGTFCDNAFPLYCFEQ